MNPDAGYIPDLWGRRQGKPLKPRQAALMASLLPRVAAPDPAAGLIDPRAVFPYADDISLEIGFGGGEHLGALAGANPRRGFIGAESFVNGVAKLLVRIDAEKLENIRIHFGDARPLMEALPDASLARLYVLFPDPWPKTRHAKRRIVSPWFFAEAARLLVAGGTLRIASDIDGYIGWTLMHARAAPAFAWTARRPQDWLLRPADWPPTRYEAKALRDGRRPVYLEFRRVGGVGPLC